MQTDLARHIEETFSIALERGYIHVYYQPVVRSISRKLCSFEALARWIDPELGFIRPDQFIPVLERMRVIHLLDTHIIRQVCATIRESVEKGQTPVPVSVNLSRLDFTLCDIFAEVRHAASDYQIPHDFLYIEITESLMADQHTNMHEIIECFRSDGFQIWMDDFGSGYSSLNVLKDFSFDEIKLDMEFLSSFDQRSRYIVASVIQMAKRIGIHTLAEGVETEEQFRFLRDIGCEKLQGYFFGCPQPLNESLAHVASLGIEIELPRARAYYDSIGKVDLLSAVPFMSREEKELALSSARQLNSIPLAIAEARADSFSVLFFNAAFEDITQNIGMISGIFAREMLREPQPYSLLPSRVINLMESTRSTKDGRMLFVSNEEYYEIQAKCVAQMRDAHCVLFRVSNLSKASESEKTSHLDDSLRQIYTLYERITLLDTRLDTIMTLYMGTREDLVSGRSDIRRIYKEYAMRWVFPEDRSAFLEFFDMDTIEDRLDAQSSLSTSVILRSLVRRGRYVWKSYTILRLRPQTYLVLIRNMQNDVTGLRSRAEAHAFAPNETEPTEEYAWRTLLNSGLINLFWKDLDRRFLGASKGFLDYYEFESENDILGKTDEDLGWHVQPDPYMNDELRVINEGLTTHNVPGHCMSHGENRDIVASKTPLYDRGGQIVGLLGYFIDTGFLAESDMHVEASKRHDMLTGLLNSRGIHEEARLFRDIYYLRNIDFARVNVAIDDMESINAQYGYDFGDKVIAALGHALMHSFEVTASVGRMSGHQFAVLCQIHSKADEIKLRERAKDIADSIREIDGVPLTLYVSVGSCRFSEVENLDEQTKKAEVRLLADHDEHTSLSNRQSKATEIFHLYDNLPISYSVYRVTTDGTDAGTDATIFYINRSFENRSGLKARDLLGKSTRELFPSIKQDWYNKARRAAFDGEIITGRMYFEPTDTTYFMTASQVIHSGYCCFTYQELDEI